MKIVRVEVFEVRYGNAAGPFALSGGRVSTGQDATVVRVETDDGLVGWGEHAVFSPAFLPGYGPSVRAALRLLAPAILLADPRQVEVVYARMEAAARGHAYAKSALDIACWDLFGKATGLRISDLLGGAHQDDVPLYTGVGIASPEEMRRNCRKLLDAGYRHVQLKVGSRWRDDVERVEACVHELRDADRVIVDANGYWPQAEAVRVLASIDALDVYVEQPCATIEECARVRRSSRRPFVLDECLGGVGDIVRAHALGAVDAVRLKLSQFGGITPVRRARDLAAALGLAMTIEDSGGADIVTAAAVHVSCSVPARLLLSAYLPVEMVAERLATGTPAATAGRALLPSGPGLGIAVDESLLGDAVLRVE